MKRLMSYSKQGFVSPLLNVWRFFGKLRKKHRRVQKETFQQISEIFENPRKSSEKIGKCCKVLKTTFQHLTKKIMKSLEIIGSLRMYSGIFGNFRKFVLKCLKYNLQAFLKFFEIFGNCRKSLEIFGKIGKRRKVLKTIF